MSCLFPIRPQARKRLAVCLASWALLLSFIATGAIAQDAPARDAPPLAIEAITGALHPGSEVVRIALSRPLQAVPASFAVQSPARIALDLPARSMPWVGRRSTSSRAMCGPFRWCSLANAPAS